jgi:hypothetical protein
MLAVGATYFGPARSASSGITRQVSRRAMGSAVKRRATRADRPHGTGGRSQS